MLTLGKIIKNQNHYTKTLTFLQKFTTTPTPTPRGRDPNTLYYDNLVSKAGESRDFPRLRNLLIERVERRSYNSKDTFKFITKTQSSLEILDELFNCLSSLNAGTHRSSAFNAFVRRLCVIGLVNNALQVLDKMRQRKINVNSTLYDPVIQTLIKKNEVEKAVSVLVRMKEVGISPDRTLYEYLLTWYCMKGDVPHAVDVMEKMMAEKGIKAASRTYDAMVLGACKVGKVEGAIMLIRAAMDDGVNVMDCTYGHVIKALVATGFYAQAVEFVMCVAGMNKMFDIECFNLLGVGLFQAERFEEANMVVDEMRKRGLSMGTKLQKFVLSHEA